MPESLTGLGEQRLHVGRRPAQSLLRRVGAVGPVDAVEARGTRASVPSESHSVARTQAAPQPPVDAELSPVRPGLGRTELDAHVRV